MVLYTCEKSAVLLNRMDRMLHKKGIFNMNEKKMELVDSYIVCAERQERRREGILHGHDKNVKADNNRNTLKDK